jgi:membrane-associated phospholipid phosphatase
MRRRLLLPLLVVSMVLFPCVTAQLFSQELAARDTIGRHFTVENSEYRNKYNLSQFGHETVDFFIRPTAWDGIDWLRLGVIGGATFLAMQSDQPVRDAILKTNGHYFRSVPIEGARMYGELYSPFVFFGGFALHYLLTDDMKSRKIAYEIGQASLYAGAIVLTLKSIIGRARPLTNEGRASYIPFTLMDYDHHSLPGGHTATAFVISTVLSRNVHPMWLKVLVYVPAVLTAYSRIYQDQHWSSDCLLGGAIGYAVADWVVDVHEQKESRIHVSSLFPLTISIALN